MGQPEFRRTQENKRIERLGWDVIEYGRDTRRILQTDIEDKPGTESFKGKEVRNTL